MLLIYLPGCIMESGQKAGRRGARDSTMGSHRAVRSKQNQFGLKGKSSLCWLQTQPTGLLFRAHNSASGIRKETTPKFRLRQVSSTLLLQQVGNLRSMHSGSAYCTPQGPLFVPLGKWPRLPAPAPLPQAPPDLQASSSPSPPQRLWLASLHS